MAKWGAGGPREGQCVQVQMEERTSWIQRRTLQVHVSVKVQPAAADSQCKAQEKPGLGTAAFGEHAVQTKSKYCSKTFLVDENAFSVYCLLSQAFMCSQIFKRREDR